MKKWLVFLTFFGWFFGFRSPDPMTPGVFVRLLVGPFPTQATCRIHSEVMEKLLEIFPDGEMLQCRESI